MAWLLSLLIMKCSKFNQTWQFCKGKRGYSRGRLWLRPSPVTVYVHVANGTEFSNLSEVEITGFLLGNWCISGTEAVPVP